MIAAPSNARKISPIKNTDALYYPYINIRDVDWLKAALLCFPHVLRMVPPGYSRNSQPINPLIDELHNTMGARREPLLGVYHLDRPPILEAASAFQRALEEELERDGEAVRIRFSQTSARDYGRGDDSTYQLHHGKFSHSLISLLRSEGLVWWPSEAYERRSMHERRVDWWAMHPLLGEALMSSFAHAAARDAGCEIVTDKPVLHHAVSQIDGDGWLKSVADRGQDREIVSRTGIIAQLVVMNTFDVSSLGLSNLKAMSKEGDALHDFRSEVAVIARSIPDVEDIKRMEGYINEAVDHILASWSEHRRNASGFSRRFFGHDLLAPSEKASTDLLNVMLAAMLPSAAAPSDFQSKIIAAAGGLAVGVIFVGAKRYQQRRKSEQEHPLRYLSLVQRSGSNVALSKNIKIRNRS